MRLAILGWLSICSGNRTVFAAVSLPEFTYREISVRFVLADGTPVAGGSIYGFCRDLNLVWPRRDHEVEGRNDVLWSESFLAKTGADGSIKAKIPPGRWGFFAVGISPRSSSSVVAAWSDYREPTSGEVIRIAPDLAKSWTLCTTDGKVLSPKKIFLKPDGFPAWIS
ncbi:MAG TPA: hypothetical protein VGI75_09465, partial [Pirellulales bacterium]